MLSTDGATNFGDFPFPSLFSNIAGNDFSVSIWIELQDITGAATFMRLIDITDDSTNFFQLVIGATNGSLSGVVSDAGTQRGATVDSAISTDTLYHVVTTWDASANTVVFYLDAVVQTGTAAANLGSGADNQFSIGRRSANTTNTFNEGFFGDVEIFDRVLPQDEVTTIFNQRGHHGIVDGSVAHYRMNETNPGNFASLNTHYKDSTTASIESTNITISVPTVADGDLMVAMICPSGDSFSTPANVTTPTGWTLMATGDLPSTSSTPSIWLYRRTASSEPGTYNFAINQTNTILAIMATWDGNEIGTTQDVISSINTGTSTTAIAPSVTPTGDALILRIAATDGTGLPSPRSNYFPTNTIGREALEASGFTNGCALGFSEHLVSSGATGTASFPLFVSDQWGAFTVAFLGGNADTDINTLRDISNSKNDGEAVFSPVIVRDELSFRKRA